jgi:hypothetical protein
MKTFAFFSTTAATAASNFLDLNHSGDTTACSLELHSGYRDVQHQFDATDHTWRPMPPRPNVKRSDIILSMVTEIIATIIID